MSRDKDPLTPTPFEPAAQQPAPASAPQPGRERRWVVPALLALLLIAAAVIFLLPQADNGSANDTAEPPATAAGEPTSPASRPTAKTSQPPETRPWSDAQQARLRKEAQDVLAQLLELQEQLEERGVTQWAAEAFNAAKTAAAEGDELYKQRQFVPARERFEASLEQLKAISAGVPEAVSKQLELARQGIEAGQVEDVTAALDQAELMAPDNETLLGLRERAAKLPDVMAKLEQATAAEAGNDLAGAESALRDAVNLDPDHERAAAELARVSERHTDQRFNRAMSEGYAALDEARFNEAQRSFRQARELRPDAGEADSALQELQTTETAHRLAGLKRNGSREEEEEQWQKAVESYQKALKLDPSVVYAQEGLERAEPRAKLDKELKAVINKPDRLSDPTVADATAKLLATGREVTAAGPVLQQQLREVDRLLQIANAPITVTLRSDQQTSVIVYKVARLGQFAEREIELRPGTYTAVGTRNGYRDVRRNFTVSPDQAPAPVTIACTEAI